MKQIIKCHNGKCKDLTDYKERLVILIAEYEWIRLTRAMQFI